MPFFDEKMGFIPRGPLFASAAFLIGENKKRLERCGFQDVRWLGFINDC
jgi:hypothetical protein